MNSEMREIGQVVKENGRLVTVRFPRKSTCEHCNMCAFKPNESHVDITLEKTLDCQIGDKVEVNITQGTVLKMSFLLYLFPLLVGLIGFLVSYLLNAGEIIQMISFVGALAIGFLLLAVFDKIYSVSKKGKPYLVRVISDNEILESDLVVEE